MISDLEIMSTRSDGLTFLYESDDWGLLELEGVDFTEFEVFTKPKGFGNGDIVIGKRRQSREIQFTAKLRNTAAYEATKARVTGYHNNNYTYDLKIRRGNTVRIAKNCELKVAKYPEMEGYETPPLTLLFLSPEADLFAANTDNVSFVSTNAMWHDTRVYEGATGSLAYGEISKATEKIINYLGSENTPIKITVNASGYVDGLIIGNGEDLVTIETELYTGDVLVIDTDERLITKNGTPVPLSDYDANALMDVVLKYGDNSVKVDSSSTAFRAEVDFVGRYGGI